MTTDEAAVEAVARVAREEREDPWADPRWEQLSEGTISAADRAALEKLAAVPGPYAEAWRAFAPLSAEFRAQVTEAVTGGVVVSMVGRAAAPASARSSSAPARRSAFGRPAWAVAGVGVLAAAAAMALLWAPSAHLAPLPAYSLELSAGAQALRGTVAEAPLPEFFPETTFDLIARPAAPAEGPVTAAGVLVGNGVRVRWTPRLDRSDEGVLRVRGPAREVLPVGPGEWTVLLAVGRGEDVERIGRALELSDTAAVDPSVLSVRLRVSASRP